MRLLAFAFTIVFVWTGPEKWSFHVADLSRTGKKCSEIIKAPERRAKVLFLFIKYAKFVALSLSSRRRS